MPDQPPRNRPNVTDRTMADQQSRAARAAEALRANLRRRKEQTRARQQEPGAGAATADSGPEPESGR